MRKAASGKIEQHRRLTCGSRLIEARARIGALTASTATPEQRNAPALNSSPFRYPNPLTGEWVKSRYVAERREIATRFAEWEIIGPRDSRSRSPRSLFHAMKSRAARRPDANGGAAARAATAPCASASNDQF